MGVLGGLLPFVRAANERHGDVFRMRFMGFGGLVVGHPEHIQHVLVSHRHNYYKGPAYDPVRRMFGDGLLTLASDDAWKDRRALVQPSFHRQSLERLAATMVESGARFFDGLATRIGGRGRIDVHDEMVRLTLDVVINALFGRDLLLESGTPFDVLGEALALLTQVAQSPLPEWLPTPRNARFKRMLCALDAHVYDIIRAARAREGDATLLAMLIASRDAQGQPLSDRELRNEVLTLFIAGHETTALTLTWMLALLADAPDVLARMREEVAAVVGGREPTFADVAKLVYVRQVVEETLRMRSPIVMLSRNAREEDAIGGFRVPKGDQVMANFWAAHFHPDFWPDPERFDPERFAPGAGKGRHPCAFLPFAAGPRSCVGNTFSLTESALLIAQLLTRFELTLTPRAQVEPVAVATVRPSKPVHAELTRVRS